ncbi:MAG: hypothetical protein BWZ10_01862 [candidate division BRC1 bacterium ADurb.BinA364]|nr:MAG: hypothetical protein BWZ10_01862 [candidate division BRC1 bacterium ADurb.BinA364]
MAQTLLALAWLFHDPAVEVYAVNIRIDGDIDSRRRPRRRNLPADA